MYKKDLIINAESSFFKTLNFILLLIISSCDMNEVSTPSPKKVPFELTQHNDKREIK